MSEQVFNVVQFGRQAAFGTPVAATTVFPVDAGFLGFELDRASESPDEDYGNSSREQAGRGSTGIRLATASLPFVARFQDLMHVFEMNAHATSGTPSGTASPYTYTYTSGVYGTPVAGTPAAQKLYTIEAGVAGSTQDEWEAQDVVASGLELGFDALSAPGNSMWRGSVELVGSDWLPATLTGSLSAPSALETMEGHLTQLFEGPSGTAFASLSELSGLKQFSFNSAKATTGRAYGGTGDKVTAWGFSEKDNVGFTAMVGINATSKTDILDIYRVAGALPTERRWRIKVSGSGVNVVTFDLRVRFTAVPVGDHDGERLYSVEGVAVRDSTLGGHFQANITNAISVVP